MVKESEGEGIEREERRALQGRELERLLKFNETGRPMYSLAS